MRNYRIVAHIFGLGMMVYYRLAESKIVAKENFIYEMSLEWKTVLHIEITEEY